MLQFSQFRSSLPLCRRMPAAAATTRHNFSMKAALWEEEEITHDTCSPPSSPVKVNTGRGRRRPRLEALRRQLRDDKNNRPSDHVIKSNNFRQNSNISPTVLSEDSNK